MRSDDTAEDSLNSLNSHPITVGHLVHTVRRYAGVIAIATLAVIIGYLVVATVLLITSRQQRVTAIPFRLEFKGSEQGQYPNGLKFSPADITATPVLLEVFTANELGRFIEFDAFRRSIYILEANRDLERLVADYQTKLADTKLTPIDRERLEREYELKRSSISKSDYSIQFLYNSKSGRVPRETVPKILEDTLRTWARRAVVEKRILDYNVPILSANVVNDIAADSDGYLRPLLLLRSRMDDIRNNLELIATIPGAELVRTKQTKTSLEELRLRLDEMIRFRLEPLIAYSRGTALLGDPVTALEVLEAQLSHDRRAAEEARKREAALRNTLLTYESSQTQSPAARAAGSSQPPIGASRETVMPQLSETFLDRIVDLSQRTADREFRQQLTNEIKGASLAVVPLESVVAYDEQMIAKFRSAFHSRRPEAAERFNSEWATLIQNVRRLLADLNELYLAASRQIYPETEIVRQLGPSTSSTYRAIPLSKIALGGLLTVLVALPLILVGVFMHSRVRAEMAADAAD